MSFSLRSLQAHFERAAAQFVHVLWGLHLAIDLVEPDFVNGSMVLSQFNKP